MMGCSSHTRPFPVWPHPGKFSARASSLRSSKRSPSSLSNASSQLCKAQGKKFHPDRSRQSPYALKHEVWLPLSQFIIKSKNVAMNTGSGLHLWNDIGQSAEISESPFSFLISAHGEDLLQTGGEKKPLLLWADFIMFFTLSWASQEPLTCNHSPGDAGKRFLIYYPLACPREPWCLKPYLDGNLHSGYTRDSFLKVWSRDKTGRKSLVVFVKNADSWAPFQTHRCWGSGNLRFNPMWFWWILKCEDHW